MAVTYCAKCNSLLTKSDFAKNICGKCGQSIVVKYTAPIKDISQPMSVSDWIITFLIMIVPIVNIVMLFIWGFGSNTNLSKASWAKAVLLLFCIIMVIYILLFTYIWF